MHEEWREAAEPWFRLEYLPPYSPDLNPIERVWKLTRRLAAHNRYFPAIEDVITASRTYFRILAHRQRCPATFMRNYLGRCIDMIKGDICVFRGKLAIDSDRSWPLIPD